MTGILLHFGTAESFKMPRRVLTPEIIGTIRTLLSLNFTHSMIKRKLSEEEIHLSVATISRVRNNGHWSQVKEKKRKIHPRKMTRDKLIKLQRMLGAHDPLSQRQMAIKLGVSRELIRYWIKKLGKKLVKKPKVHHMTSLNIEKRRMRTHPLYLKLNKNKWRNFITSDEAWFYLNSTGGKRVVQYIDRHQTVQEADVRPTGGQSKKLMVWMAFSSHGFFKPIFVDGKAKVDKLYYQERILKPFIKEYRERFGHLHLTFQQDGASSHTAHSSVKLLEDENIPFLRPSEWPSGSPDLSPCDYWLWPEIKRRVNRRKVRSLAGLKLAIKEEVKKIPHSMIERALAAWPKRVRQVYLARGGYIENRR